MVTTIRKYTGGAHPFLEFACLSTDTKPVALVPDNSLCHEIDTGKRYYFANKAWHEAPARGGSGDGECSSSLPTNFPTEGTENANKFAGFDENGLWTAKDVPSGGGAEKFVVTLTQDEQTDEWTADEDVNDIYAAYQAGKIVSFIINASQPIEYTDVGAMEVNYQGIDKAVLFSGIDDKKSVFIFAGYSQLAEGDDVWAIEYSDNELPSHSSSNNGQVLGVSSGSLAWVDNHAPLIVTMTEDENSPGTYVGDKAYSEALSAMTAGKNVTCIIEGLSASHVVDAVQLTVESEQVVILTLSKLDANGTSSLYTLSGSPNEYIKINLS